MTGREIVAEANKLRFEAGLRLLGMEIIAFIEVHGDALPQEWVRLCARIRVPNAEPGSGRAVRPTYTETVLAASLRTPEEVYQRCRKMLHHVVTHEVDEGLWVEEVRSIKARSCAGSGLSRQNTDQIPTKCTAGQKLCSVVAPSKPNQPKAIKPLNQRQRLFVDAYVESGIATDAAVKAGYSVKAASNEGPRLLKHPAVAAAIDGARAKAAELAQSKASKVVEELEHVAHSDIGELFDAKGNILALAKMEPRARRAISSIEFEDGKLKRVKLWSKEAALGLLGKYHRLFIEKLEVAGRDGAPLIFNVDLSGART